MFELSESGLELLGGCRSVRRHYTEFSVGGAIFKTPASIVFVTHSLVRDE